MKVHKNATLTSKTLRDLADALEALEKSTETVTNSTIIVHHPESLKIEDVWSGDIGKFSYNSSLDRYVFHPAKSIFE